MQKTKTQGKYGKLNSFYKENSNELGEKAVTEIEGYIGTLLTEKQWQYYKVPSSGDEYLVFKCLYICRYRLNYTTVQMSELFGIGTRAIQNLLKKVGWERSFQEAQQLAADVSRDYHAIHTKANKTRVLSRQLGVGSATEEFARQYIKVELDKVPHEVIVGCSNLNILSSGREVDIPIIIFKGTKVHRFAIEINGEYWHDGEVQSQRDKEKIRDLKIMGYRLITVNINTQNKGRITSKLDGVCNEIMGAIN